ncbi:hypothetical protein ACLSZQ_07805, partial [Avibacterium volantium]
KKKFLNFKNVNDIKVSKENSLIIVFGKKFDMDRKEMDNINNDTFKIIPLNYSGHGSSIPLTIPDDKDKKWIIEKFSNLKIDPDLKELDKPIVNLVDEIFEIYKDPKMRLYALFDSYK